MIASAKVVRPASRSATAVQIGMSTPTARATRAGAVATLYQICTDTRLNHRVEVVGAIMAEEAAQVLKSFFAARRAHADRQQDG